MRKLMLSLLLMMAAMYLLDRRKYRRGGDTVPHLTRRMLAVALPLAVSAYARTSLTTLEHLLIPRGLKGMIIRVIPTISRWE